MNKTIITSTVILLLSGCGGSSGDSSDDNSIPVVVEPAPVVVEPAPVVVEPAPVVVEPAPVVVEPTPTEIITSAPLFSPNTSVTSCDGLDYINLINAQSLATSTVAFSSANAIDNLLTAEGRWETTDTSAALIIDLGYRHEIKEIGTAWYQGDENITTFSIDASEDGITYTTLLSSQTSSGETELFEHFDIPDTVARFVRIISAGDNQTNTTSLLEAAVFGCPLDVTVAPLESQTIDTAQFGLDPDLPPGGNFDLITWAIDTPELDPRDGQALRTGETDLDNGHADEFFFTADDGGMVFKSTVGGATTSENTSFTRSELREQLREGNTSISTQGVNTNNWVLGYQPETPRQVGGRGGRLTATLKVDHVATAGDNISQSHEGRFIIGQIHAEDDEPLRLYFKKFEDNDRGYIYFAHEPRGENQPDLWRVVVGNELSINESRQPVFSPDFTDNPEQGIALGEIFSYEIDQSGSRVDVIIRRGDLNGPIIGHNFVDMVELNSGYDVVEEWNYFKAGAYSQNNTGDPDDFFQTTFYALSNTHDVNTQVVDPSVISDGQSGNQFAQIIDTDDDDTGELRYSLPNALSQGRLEVRFTRTDDDAGSTDGFISLFNSGNNNAGSILDLRVRDNSFQTRFPQVNIDTDIAEVTPGSFQTAVITWEYPGGDTDQLPIVTIEIDGTEIVNPFTPVGSNPVGGVSTVSFRFGSDSNQLSPEAILAIDDIRIYSDTAGNNLVFTDTFESYDNLEDLSTVTDENSSIIYNSRTSEASVATEQ